MNDPRNAPAYAELLLWMEEAVEYVNKPSRSPSLEADGRKLLRLAEPAPELSMSMFATRADLEAARKAQVARQPEPCSQCGATWTPHICSKGNDR